MGIDDEKLSKHFDSLQWQIDELKRHMQQQHSAHLELSSHVGRLESRLISLNEMIEDRQEH